jgi:hypothetical protein
MKINISETLNKKSVGKEIICLVEIVAMQREIYSVTKSRFTVLHSHSLLASSFMLK